MNKRYRTERAKIDLALTMIAREARTSTIKCCTGLSDDRIRRLCTQYFSTRDGRSVRRRRGKSPHQIAKFVKNAEHQLQATTIMHLLITAGLLRVTADGTLQGNWLTVDVDIGQQFCDVYDLYQLVHSKPLFGFEWGWNLMQALGRDEALAMAHCDRCEVEYLHDRYSLDFHICPACEIRTERRRRPGARQYATGGS
ncbi:MAG: hypothetical protein AAF290_13115 [Pseudomonadota bacterium]